LKRLIGNNITLSPEDKQTVIDAAYILEEELGINITSGYITRYLKNI